MNVAIYLRVSTPEQKEHGYSLGEQQERLAAYCKAKGWRLVKTYEDGGYTGANLDRPAIQRLMHECGIYDLVLVWKLDRLSRSQKDTLSLIEHFKEQGTAFASMQENFDTSTAFGMAMVGILSVFAQLEREQIKERMSMGKEGRAKSGKYHGGKPPIGYDYDSNTGKLVPNEEADQVVNIYRMFLEGVSQYDIAKYAHNNYVSKVTPYNNDTIIRKILRNPVYIGTIKHRNNLVADSHPPIIDKDTFDRAQVINEKNAANHRHVSRKRILYSRVFCSCGQSMRLHYVNDYGYYECYGSIHHTTKRGGCGNRIRIEKVEEAVKNNILSLKFSDIKPKVIEKKDNTAELRKIEKQIARLLDLYQIDSIPIGEVKQRIEALERKKSSLTAQEAPVRDLSVARDILSSARETFDSGDVAKSRLVVSALIEKVIVGKGKMEIHWTFS